MIHFQKKDQDLVFDFKLTSNIQFVYFQITENQSFKVYFLLFLVICKNR